MTKVITDDEYLKAIGEKEGKQGMKEGQRGREMPKTVISGGFIF